MLHDEENVGVVGYSAMAWKGGWWSKAVVCLVVLAVGYAGLRYGDVA